MSQTRKRWGVPRLPTVPVGSVGQVTPDLAPAARAVLPAPVPAECVPIQTGTLEAIESALKYVIATFPKGSVGRVEAEHLDDLDDLDEE